MIKFAHLMLILCCLNSLSRAAEPVKSIKPSSAQSIDQFALFVTPAYGWEIGSMKGINTIIGSYNNNNASILHENMPEFKVGEYFGMNAGCIVNRLFVGIGVSFVASRESGILEDRANMRFRYRENLHMRRLSLNLKGGYAMQPNSFIRLTVGPNLELGNYKFNHGLFAPTRKVAYARDDYRKREKYAATYLGGFASIYIGGLGDGLPFALMIESSVMRFVGKMNLEDVNATLNPNSYMADDNASLNLQHSFVGFKVGLAMGLFQ